MFKDFHLGRGELTGGLAAALVSLPVSMTHGVVAFALLGPKFVGTGLIAGSTDASLPCARVRSFFGISIARI